MRREERVTVQGPVKEQQPDGMSHRGADGNRQLRSCRTQPLSQPWPASVTGLRCPTLWPPSPSSSGMPEAPPRGSFWGPFLFPVSRTLVPAPTTSPCWSPGCLGVGAAGNVKGMDAHASVLARTVLTVSVTAALAEMGAWAMAGACAAAGRGSLGAVGAGRPALVLSAPPPPSDKRANLPPECHSQDALLPLHRRMTPIPPPSGVIRHGVSRSRQGHSCAPTPWAACEP